MTYNNITIINNITLTVYYPYRIAFFINNRSKRNGFTVYYPIIVNDIIIINDISVFLVIQTDNFTFAIGIAYQISTYIQGYSFISVISFNRRYCVGVNILGFHHIASRKCLVRHLAFFVHQYIALRYATEIFAGKTFNIQRFYYLPEISFFTI